MWDELIRWIAPRRVVRVDPDGSHRYADADVRPVAEGEPQAPYALHLTTEAHRYAHVVFDLDTGRHPDGVGAVWRDADQLLEHLEAQGLEYVVAASGPAGGIHVWVPVSAKGGMEASDVERLARAAARHLPSLDFGMLCNPAKGAVRPPGSPHRAGGRSQLQYPTSPEAALAVFRTGANTAAAFERLAVALGVEEMEAEQAASAEEDSRIDERAMRLRGRRRPMPDMVRHLLGAASTDASAHLFSIFKRLALARWSRADVRDLAASEPTAPGLEHLRTARSGTGGRRPRRPEERAALLDRQWERAVRSAATTAPTTDRTERDTALPRALAAQALAATADPQWWTAQAGQCDRRALLAVHLIALTACVVEVDVDVRRLAQTAGISKSTAAAALKRLCLDQRLTRSAEGQGQHSHRYRLLPVDQWTSPHEGGRTQREPTPGGNTPQGDFLPSRENLTTRLRDRLEQAQHDVWAEYSPTHPRGLGRHVELTYTTLTELSAHLDTVDLQTLSARTGYSTATTAAHLRALVEHRLIEARTLRPRTPATTAMNQAATRLGTRGVGKSRERRYAAERAVFAAWQDELARRRTPLALRHRRRRRDRYATRADGSFDHAAQLARHLVAA